MHFEISFAKTDSAARLRFEFIFASWIGCASFFFYSCVTDLDVVRQSEALVLVHATYQTCYQGMLARGMQGGG